MAGAAALDVLSLIQPIFSTIRFAVTSCRGSEGFAKQDARIPFEVKGKRGGYRFLYLYLESRHHIHLLYLLDKDEQEDLTNEERKALRVLVSQVRASR